MQLVAALGVGLFAGSVAFLLSVVGAVLALFMLPKLALVYNQATLPLQLLASRMAAGILTAVGIGVIREGNILDVAGHRVSVVEACNGIRYLLSLGFMAVVFAYLSDTKLWMRMALLAAAAAWLPSLDAGTPHAISGGFLFVLCLATLVRSTPQPAPLL